MQGKNGKRNGKNMIQRHNLMLSQPVCVCFGPLDVSDFDFAGRCEYTVQHLKAVKKPHDIFEMEKSPLRTINISVASILQSSVRTL